MSDPAKYRPKEELQDYKDRDPIEYVKAHILKSKFASEEELKEIDTKIKADVLESVKFAEESAYPDPSEAFKDVYVQDDYPYITD